MKLCDGRRYGRWVIALLLSTCAIPAFGQVSVTLFGGYAVSEGIDNTTRAPGKRSIGRGFGIAGDTCWMRRVTFSCSTVSKARR